MTKLISKLFFSILLTSIIFSCSFNNLLKDNNTTTVRIAVPQNRSMQDLVNSVSQYKLDVTGPSMDTISTFIVSGEAFVLVIRSGENRKFVLTALNSSGKEIFKGETTVDLIPNTPTTLSITLSKLNGQITFDLNGGTGVTLNNVGFEDIFTTGLPIVEIGGSISKTNATFTNKWNSEPDGTGNFSIEYITDGYIEFYENGAIVTDTTSGVSASGVVDGQNKSNIEAIWPIEPTQMYAQWNEQQTVSFDMTGDINNNQPPNDINAFEGDTVTLPFPEQLQPILNEEGYGFGGWMTTPNGVNATIYMEYELPKSISMPSGGLNLYIYWIPY